MEKRNQIEKIKWLDDLLQKDLEWKQIKKDIDDLKHKRNRLSEEINKLKKENKDVNEKLKEAKSLPNKIELLERRESELREKINFYLMRIPNTLHESVPIGKDDSENIEIRKNGRAPKFDFKARDHLEIALSLGLIDAERAAKITGHGFFYLKKELVLLDYAILKFTLDLLFKRGFTPIEPPFMMNRKPYEGVVDLSDFEGVMYKIEKEDLYLIATSEHPMAAMYMDEVLDKKDLPIKLVGISPCFRKEVGAHGKYTKGLFRMHQFNKIEQFVFCLPEQSWQLHDELQKNSEDLYQALGLHYRVVNVCTGDMGVIAAKKYDTEVWMVDGKFREAGSNSNCTEYQARRLNIKFREGEGKIPVGFVHTLNNTAIATSRTMMAILEQYQQKDGSVKIPDVLVSYMNGIKVIKRK